MATWTNNVPNTFYPDGGNMFQNSVGTFDLECEEGYFFDGDITVTYNGGKNIILEQNETKTKATKAVSDYSGGSNVTFNGKTKEGTAPEPPLTVQNNVPNTTATGEKLGTASAKVTLTADEGFTIQSAKVAFTDSYGNPANEDMAISEGGKSATWQNDDCDTGEPFTITGETASDNELDVTNNIPNTTATGEKLGAASAKVTLTANEGFKIQSAKVAFTDGYGYPTSEDMTIREDGKSATWQNDNCQPKNGVTLSGETASEGTPKISIETNFSNCYADPPLPEFLQYGETLNVTLKANENTAFDTEQSTPKFSYYDDMGYPASKDLTVSEDKQTATGSIVIQDGWQDLSVNAQAYPVAVVGEQYGAINVYLVTLDELAEFSKKRFFKETGNDPETGAAIYENIDLGAYVNRIRRIYTNIGASSTDVIRCGNYNTGVSCHQPATDKITLDFGTAVVPAHNEDNTDYESEIQIFLPFAGFVNLNNDYAGKTIALQYVINVVTGNGVALLSCNGVVFQVEETEPSSEIIYLSPSTQVKTVGGDDWNEMLYYGLEPYIYCKWYESASEGRNTDRQTGILGDFRGFNVFDDVTPIHTAEMLTEEQEMIYTALSDGVYIE